MDPLQVIKAVHVEEETGGKCVNMLVYKITSTEAIKPLFMLSHYILAKYKIVVRILRMLPNIS